MARARERQDRAGPSVWAAPSPSRAAARRAVWGVADQAASSITNFVVLVVAARALDRDAFGALAIALAVYAVALGVTRALSGEPLVVCYSAAPRARAESAACAALGTAFIAGVVGGIVLAGAGVALGGDVGTALVVLGVTIPGLLVQDTARFAFFVTGRARAACANDVVWLVALGSLLLAAETHDLVSLLGAWGAGAGIAAGVAMLQLRVVPSTRPVRDWLRRHGGLWPRYVVEFLTMAAGWQAALVGLGVIAGLAAVGALRAGQILVGPLNVAFLAVPLVAVPESARLWRVGRGTPPRHGAWLSTALAGSALAWGLVVATIPDEVGASVLGASWSSARALLVPLVVVTAAIGINLGGLCALRVLGAARESMTARLIAAPLVLVLAIAGGVIGGAVGAAWGWAVAELMVVPVWWRAVGRASRARGVAAVDPPLEAAWAAAP